MNYQLSNVSPKMSNSTCFTKLNRNIFLCRRAKQAKKFQIIPSCLSKSNPNVLFIGKQNELKNVKQNLFYQPKS